MLMELKGENPFKVRAYSAGARAIEALEKEEFEKLVAEGGLRSLKGIGEALASKITELHATGRLEFLDRLKESIEPGLVDLLRIRAWARRRSLSSSAKLGVTSIPELEKACRDGKVAALDGFGEKTQEKLLAGIANREAYSRRHHWWTAAEVAEPILARPAIPSPGGKGRVCRQPEARPGDRRRPGFHCRGEGLVADRRLVHLAAGHPGGDGEGGNKGERAPGKRPAGRPADCPLGAVRVCAPPLHGLEGPQRADAPAFARPGAQLK